MSLSHINNIALSGLGAVNGVTSISAISGIAASLGGGGGPPFANVSLLLHMNGADASTTFTDSSSNNHTINVGADAQLDTAQVKYGSAAGLFDGNGDFIDAPDHASFAFGTGDFTIETWVYPTAGTTAFIYDARATGSELVPVIYFDSDTDLRFYDGSADRITATISSALNAWGHVALSRVSGTTRLFWNGTQVGSNYTDGNTYVQTAPRIGRHYATTIWFTGSMDDYRVVKGFGAYSANFTPPAAQLPDS